MSHKNTAKDYVFPTSLLNCLNVQLPQMAWFVVHGLVRRSKHFTILAKRSLAMARASALNPHLITPGSSVCGQTCTMLGPCIAHNPNNLYGNRCSTSFTPGSSVCGQTCTTRNADCESDIVECGCGYRWMWMWISLDVANTLEATNTQERTRALQMTRVQKISVTFQSLKHKRKKQWKWQNQAEKNASAY